MDKRIAIGSQVFFSQYDDYESHDKDYVEFQDEPKLFKKFMIVRENGNDIFYYKTMSKGEFIEYELKHVKNIKMAAGKFLVPELAEYIGLTIEDLKLFEKAFRSIDERHKYEEVIYDYYIQNNGFSLTDEQRDNAYQKYKEKNITNN